MARPPDLSIVIATHNRAALLERTLASLRGLTKPPDATFEVVVVANACRDGTLDVVHGAVDRLPGSVHAIEQSEASLSLARSRGAAAARADVIAFLDDDVWVEREWLGALLAAAAGLPGGLFAGRVTLEWETGRPPWASDGVDRLLSANDLGDAVRELEGASQLVGANFAVRRSIVEKVGGFSPALGRRGVELLSGEESDFVQRALEVGHRLFYVPAMGVRHWIPRERATLDHLRAVAYGRGRSRVVLQRMRRQRSALACARLGAAQAVLGAVRALQGWVQRDEAKRVAATLLHQRGLGTLCGLAGLRAVRGSGL